MPFLLPRILVSPVRSLLITCGSPRQQGGRSGANDKLELQADWGAVRQRQPASRVTTEGHASPTCAVPPDLVADWLALVPRTRSSHILCGKCGRELRVRKGH